MPKRLRLSAFLPTLALCAALAGSPREASADAVELANGAIVQGRIVAGQTTEEGLAVELYETGGVILVRWDHILESRKQELRRQIGIDPPPEQTILVPGHTVLLATREIVEGLALNPDAKSEPLRLKNADGERTYDRAQVQRIDAKELDGLLVYKPDELYQWLRDQNPPDTPAAHKALGVQAMQIGALAKARVHLGAAAADADFLKTSEGRALETLLRQLDDLEKSAGAQALKKAVEDAIRRDKHNDALAKFRQLEEQYQDESIRKVIGFAALAQRVERTRDAYFRREVQKKTYSTMTRLIEAKAREKKSTLPSSTTQPRGVAAAGTLAAARQWCARELPTQLWEKVGTDLGLDSAELERYWKERSGTTTQTATYGTGSFIVIKKAAPAARSGDQPRQRRPPGSTRDDGNKGPRPAPKEDKQKTEEEWWEIMQSGDKSRWLTAHFAESSGFFDIRVDESEMCDNCGGKGILLSSNTDGSQSQSFCTKCNGSAKFRRVHYR